MNPLSSPLLTDLYELTMLQAYLERGMEETAVFELFVRRLPPERNFLMAAGLEQALDFIEGLRFGEAELEWIAGCGLFKRNFADRLARLRFTGDVHAVPEGTVVFGDEPLMRVVAPMPEAQLLETRVVNLLHLQTLIASKAARCRLAAPGKGLVDFGLRRAHGAEAGLLAARASWLAGFDGTATALAAPRFGIPVFGTMAHSFVQAHDNERAAFEAFAAAFPGNAVLLVDTYDTIAGVRKAAALAGPVKGVRLDSGDLGALAREARAVLDAAGRGEAIIFASGNLDEHRLAALVRAGAPIDSFGVGTSLVTSADQPSLDMVYKLQEYAGRPRRKRSTGKATWPGRKQVYRECAPDGMFRTDHLCLESEDCAGEPLLRPVMKDGRRLAQPDLGEARRHAADQLRRLPPPLRALDAAPPYPVAVSGGLRRLAQDVDRASA